MRALFVLIAFSVLAACGKDVVAPPAPIATGTIYFALQGCEAYATAQYVVDSTSVGIESIVSGVASKGYSVPSGNHATHVRVLKAGATLGLWTINDIVNVPENGQVTAHHTC